MRATKAQFEARVTTILRMRVAGAAFEDLREYALAQEWNVSDGQLWRYVARSDEVLAAAVEKNRDKLFARHLARRELLYAKCVEIGDFKGALACLKDQAELENLYPPTKHQHSGPDGGPIPHDHRHAVTDDDRAAALAALFERQRAAAGGRAAKPNGDGH